MPPRAFTLRHRLSAAPEAIGSGGQLDLRPLDWHGEATKMVQMARGELNEAFRRRGLFSPDPMPTDDRPDDLAAFERWAADMPLRLVPLLLSILWRTHDTLCARRHDGPGAEALRTACAFLLSEPGPEALVLDLVVEKQR